MPEPPSNEEIAKWHRWFAIEFNNRAWELAENPDRSSAQRDEMLHAAHASVLHWRNAGTELHKARAEMLLAQVHALLGNGAGAIICARRSYEYVTSHESPDWEIALAHAVLANAAHAAAEFALHVKHYTKAKSLGEAIQDPEEKETFFKTFSQLPRP